MSAPAPPAPPTARAAAPAAPERWSVDAGGADIATLDIPPSAQRGRVFAVDVRFVVRAGERPAPWLALTVELDGRRQWSRRIEAHAPGQTDSLDYHCRCELPAGRALRVRALTQVGAAQRLRLQIEAEEESAR